MKAKEYLSQIKDLEDQIKSILDDIQHLDDLATSITQTAKADIVQTSGSKQKMADAATSIVDKQEKLKQTVEIYLHDKDEIIQQIKSLDEKPQRDLLMHRYVKHKTFEKIAVDMNYSWRHIIRLHGDALVSFSEKYHDFL